MKRLLLVLPLITLISATSYALLNLPSYSSSKAISRVQPKLIKEASGIGISVKNPGIAWIHNDGGNAGAVFAIRLSDGSCVANVTLKGASASDLEDMALGKYNGVDTLFIADIGDNKLQRRIYTINSLEEPDLTGITNCAKMTLSVSKIKFKYPDEKGHNSEAIMYSEEHQRLYIITKAAKTEFFEFKSMDTAVTAINQLDKIGNIQLSPVTSANMSRDGQGLLIRTYREIREMRKLPGEDADQFLKSSLRKVPAAAEPQGEAVAYDLQGNYYQVSEGVNPYIYKISRLISQ
jgi:hypothetical protein